MSTARTPEEAAQISKDRKTLLRGALVAGAGLYGGYRLLKKSGGPVVGGTPWVPAAPKAKPLRKGDKVQANALRKGKTAQGAMDRQIKAGDLRARRAYDAMRPVSSKKLSKLTPQARQKYGQLVTAAETAKARVPKNAAGQIAPKEAFLADREARRKARVEVAKFRRTKGFGAVLLAVRELAEQRDRMDLLRDTAVAAGALASGGAAVYGAREWAKTNRAAQGAVKQIVPKLDPKEIVREGVNQIGSKAKRKAKEYFPTFIKGGKTVSRVLKKKILATPADGLIEFAGQEQWKDPNDRTYNNPLRVAAGMQHGYYRTEKDGTPIVEDLPIAHSQTIKAALNKGKVIHRTAKRTGSLAKDVVDTARGKPRAKDAAGRTKKREWEKSWFRNKVGEVATGAALLGGATYLRKSPKGRAAVVKGEKWMVKQARRVNPDAFPKGRVFATPAAALIDFARKPVDPEEEKKVMRAARLRNGLVGAAAGSFLGAGLYGGKSGYSGARIGAALGGLYGASSNPKRRAAIEQLQVAAFATPADHLIDFAKPYRAISVKRYPGQPLRPGKARGQFYNHVMGHGRKVPARGGEGVKEAAAIVRVYKGNPVGKEIEAVRKRIAKTPHLAYAAKHKSTPALVEKSTKYGDVESYKKGSREVKDRIDDLNRLRARGKDVRVAAGALGSPLVEADFQTPADRLIGFDAVAHEAGWDIRDPRGKSARVFAPGSRKRERRDKEWHEKVDNERKLWKAGMLAAAVAAGAGGAAVGRRFPRKPKAVIDPVARKVADPVAEKVVEGPWQKSG
jgi:hypothetical protein